MIYREENESLPYLEALSAAGVEAIPVCAEGAPRLGDFDGLVLTGGTDVDPALYGESRGPETEEPDRERDELEIASLGQALESDLPVLAICRGLQLMNVFHGGTLVQHLSTVEHHRVRRGNRAEPVHGVLIEPGSLLNSIAGTNEWRVNSRHHQAIKTVGNGLVVSGIDPEDRVVEAVERPDKHFVLAVQWHPENQALGDAGQLKIFQRFGAAMSGGRHFAQSERGRE